MQRRLEITDLEKHRRQRRARLSLASAAVSLGAGAPLLFAQLTGQTGAHDPSSLFKDGSTYYYFATGQGILSRSSTNTVSWSAGQPVFSTPPAWTTQSVPNFTGLFWAPDVAYFNGKYHLYYSASSWGAIDSAIGVATSPSLSNPTWTDQGKVVQSNSSGQAGPNTDTTAYNAIDPSVFLDNSTGRLWMTFGSYFSGIVVTELNPSTGKRLNTGSFSSTLVANNAPGGGWGSTIEASSLTKRGNYYYLFVNYGTCCSGVNSTYDIRVGRSTSPTGPFVDKNGVDMRNGGGSLFLDDDGKMIGPGHFSQFSEAGQDYFGYHYYNGDANGNPTYGLRKLYWTADNWPSYAAVNPGWSGAATSAWSNSANWSGATVPNGAGHVANFASITSGRYVVSLDAPRTLATVNFTGNASYTIGTAAHLLTLDAPAGDSATLNVQSGNHTIAAPVTAVDQLGINVVSGSRLNLTGSVTAAGLTKYGLGTVAFASAATFTQPIWVKWGSIDVTGAVTTSSYTSVGHAAAEGAVLIVRGTGSFTASNDLNIGDSGNAADPATGRLEIRDNATITLNPTAGFFVGSGFFSGARAAGTVIHQSGTLTANGNFDGAFVIGGRNSTLTTGTYSLSSGTVNANTNVQVGGRGTGSMIQPGGTFNTTGFLSIGRYPTATGTWHMTGGTLNQSSAARSLIVGEEGAGTLAISGSASVNLAGSLRIGLTSTGTGTVNLNGGTLTAPQISRGTGAATFNFNGGTLRPSASTATFLQGLTSARVQAAGAIVDTRGFNVTIAQPLLHDPALGASSDGGLTKLGPGSLTLTGANTYTGLTTVSDGTLALRPSAFNPVLTGPAGADITLGKLILDYAGASTPLTTVRSRLATGDIRSSLADPTHALGYYDNGANVTVLLTLPGDANLDGELTLDDYTLIDKGFATNATVWWLGDFNYDGAITSADYLLIDRTFLTQSPAFSPAFLSQRESQFGPEYVSELVTAIPEPGAFAVALILPALCPRRRRNWGIQRPKRPH